MDKKLVDGVHQGILNHITNNEPLSPQDAQIWRMFRIMKEMGWSFDDYEKTPLKIRRKIWDCINTDIAIRNYYIGQNNG